MTSFNDRDNLFERASYSKEMRAYTCGYLLAMLQLFEESGSKDATYILDKLNESLLKMDVKKQCPDLTTATTR